MGACAQTNIWARDFRDHPRSQRLRSPWPAASSRQASMRSKGQRLEGELKTFLQRSDETTPETTPSVISYNPALPNLAYIIHKHFNVLYSSDRCWNHGF